MGNIVEVKGLTRSFGDVKAVDNMDFNVGAGSVLGLIGPNGAGKTTMLKALLGLTEFSGEAQVLGINPRSDRAHLMEQVCFIADTAVTTNDRGEFTVQKMSLTNIPTAAIAIPYKPAK